MQHEHSPGVVLTHQHVYIDSATPIDSGLLVGKGDETFCCVAFREAYRSVLGAVAWTQAHAFRINGYKRFNLVIRHMERHKCGLKSVALNYPFKLVGAIHAAFKSQPGEPKGLTFRGLVATLQEDDCKDEPMSSSGKANLVGFTVRIQRRVARSTFSAELHWLADAVEQMLLLQVALHHVYCRCRPWLPLLLDRFAAMEEAY